MILGISQLTWDHPRVCGEHNPKAFYRRHKAGSSPRMRGALVIDFARNALSGIIPAYAGSTIRTSYNRNPKWDHPRVCGEH